MMTKSLTSDLLFFAALTAVITFLLQKKAAAASSTNTCNANESTKTVVTKKASPLKNSAIVFIKPHANTLSTQKLVRTKLTSAGLSIMAESSISGETIDALKLIDQHYYAIASKATLLPASSIPVPKDKFQAEFGESWDTVLKEERAVNALEACRRFECTAEELNEAWAKCDKVVKFGGGFYCGLVTFQNQKSLYVFNAFFMTMRSKFVGKGTSIYCYEVEWKKETLSWSDFRNRLVGPTDPADGPSSSIRRIILDTYKELGLTSEPNKGDNGIHASASAFEGLAEKTNWLSRSIGEDTLGRALLDAGLSEETIVEWSVDPRIELVTGEKGSVFDALEDMDAEDCLAMLVKLNELNSNLV